MKNAIVIFGQKENLENVCKKVWELGNFGSTIIDGNELDVFVRDYTDADNVQKLIDYASGNSCYFNGTTAKFLENTYNITGFKEA